jgi:hypothetical protein
MTADRFAPVRAVADAVLYEGYVLYPYRASATKNHVRWQFGVVAPRPFALAHGGEAWAMRAACVVDAPPGARIDVRLRCLQVDERRVETRSGADGSGWFVGSTALEADGVLHTSFDEGVERELALGPYPVEAGAELVELFGLPGRSGVADVLDGERGVVGRIVRSRQALRGRVDVARTALAGGLTRIELDVSNVTDWSGPGDGRDDVVRRSFVGTHLLLGLDRGAFVSLLDPPAEAAEAVATCRNSGCFPVLAGPPDRSDLLLVSPIILYDHPQVAPESLGDLYDATEIDEILTLRTMALTDDEKREARATDPRAAEIVDRVDHLPPALLQRLHGVMRSLRPAPIAAPAPDPPAAAPWWDPEADASVDPASDTVTVGGRQLAKGSRVRLRPHAGGDAQDMFVAGREAIVAGVFHDVDGGIHLAVTIEGDPAAELDEWYGRFRYFAPDEVEVLGAPDGREAT